ncbi:kinase-like domain-containing protein [Aspergillus carlsbadensis]|nr:kinase-like domain-containing protein [Aspergillus carlsbadensis]
MPKSLHSIVNRMLRPSNPVVTVVGVPGHEKSHLVGSAKATSSTSTSTSTKSPSHAPSESSHHHHLRATKQTQRRSSIWSPKRSRNHTPRPAFSSCSEAEWEEWARSESGALLGGDSRTSPIIRKYGPISDIIAFTSQSVLAVLHFTQAAPHIDAYYALKVFRRGSQQSKDHYENHIRSEFLIGSLLQHQNIIRTFELVPIATDTLGSCMEYCQGGDLHTLITTSGTLDAEEANCFFKQLMRGIQYLHEMGVAHRDLKPENLLLTTRGCLKISDFGNAECFRLAGEEDVHLSSGVCGSTPYISPEQFIEEEFDPRGTDIWAAALIYIAMNLGRNMWKVATPLDEGFADFMEQRKFRGKVSFIEDTCSIESRKVIYSMLSISPEGRPGSSSILASRWLQDIPCCNAGCAGV